MCSDYNGRGFRLLLPTMTGVWHKFWTFFCFSSAKGWSDYITAFCVAVTLPAWWWCLPSLANISASALSRPETAKSYWRLSFCSYVNIFRTTAALWYCMKSPPLPSSRPLVLSSSRMLPLVASQWFSPSAQANEAKRRLPNAFPMWTGLRVGICVTIAEKAIKPRPWDCRLKWCCTEHRHHHRNLERPSLAESKKREGSQEGALSNSCADSAPWWSSWRTTKEKENQRKWGLLCNSIY